MPLFLLIKTGTLPIGTTIQKKIIGLNREQVLGKIFGNYSLRLKNHSRNKIQRSYNKSTNSFISNFLQEQNLWVEVSVYPSKAGLSIYYKDITSTKAYEDALRASNDRFEKSTAATNDAIWDWDIEKLLVQRRGFYQIVWI